MEVFLQVSLIKIRREKRRGGVRDVKEAEDAPKGDKDENGRRESKEEPCVEADWLTLGD